MRAEDAVVRHERHREVNRGGGDPSIGIVIRLGERVPGAFAGNPEIDVRGQQRRPGPDDLSSMYMLTRSLEARWTPRAPS